MSWRLPPPIWIATQRKTTLLGKLLHAGAVAWRLAKWSLAAGATLAVLEWLTARAELPWQAGAWLAAGALLLLLWERYGLADSALATGRVSRWIVTAVIVLCGGGLAWLVASALRRLA